MRATPVMGALAALAAAAATVFWAHSTSYPGVGVTVAPLPTEIVHSTPPRNTTGVPSAGLDTGRDAMGGLWISAPVQGDPNDTVRATLYVPAGRGFLRGVSSRIESTATDSTFGVVRWRVTVVVGQDLPIPQQSICLELTSQSGDRKLMGNCP